jgi:hypothetical protein
MAHFTRELSDAGWYRGLKVPQTVIRNIDEKTKKAVSGTGGTYNPAAAIIIGGAGIELQSQLSVGSSAAFPGAGKNFIFGDNDFFQYESPVTKVVTTPSAVVSYWTTPRQFLYRYSENLAQKPALQSRQPGASMRFPLRIPNGSVLSSVSLKLIVGTSHTNPPQYMPRMRIVRVTAAGVVEKHPNVSTASADADGWVQFTRPATGTLWVNSGNPNTLTIEFSTLSMLRSDVSTYGYHAEYRDEYGTDAKAGNVILGFDASVLIQDIRPY